MINPKELRLGNWIARRQEGNLFPIKVVSLEAHTVNGLPLEQLEPIRLAGVHLLQAGFQYNGAVYYGGGDGKMEFSFDLEHNEYVTIDDHMGGQAILYRSFHFLHEVQNLIYEVTRKELPITL
jgi:hypothetical protein